MRKCIALTFWTLFISSQEEKKAGPCLPPFEEERGDMGPWLKNVQIRGGQENGGL